MKNCNEEGNPAKNKETLGTKETRKLLVRMARTDGETLGRNVDYTLEGLRTPWMDFENCWKNLKRP